MGTPASLISDLGLTTALVGAAPLVLFAFGIMYVLADLRHSRGGERDPLLGAQVALTLFMTIGFQLLLLSSGMALGQTLKGKVSSFDEKVNALNTTPAVASSGDDSKLAGVDSGTLALMATGGFTLLYAAVLYLLRVRRNSHGRVGRQAAGINAVVTGLGLLISLGSLLLMVFARLSGSSTLAWDNWLFQSGADDTLAFMLVYLFGNLLTLSVIMKKSAVDAADVAIEVAEIVEVAEVAEVVEVAEE
jgi:hypothetical protein